MSKPIDTKQMAQNKAYLALRRIEEAQLSLGEACRELSSIRGAMDEWEWVGEHYDRTKALWHRVMENLQFDTLDLDEETKRRIGGGS